MSDQDAENLAELAFKIVIFLIFGVFILLGLGFKHHPKATLAILAIAAVVLVFAANS